MENTLERQIYDIALRMRLLRALDDDSMPGSDLSERQILLLELLSERGKLTISDITAAYPRAKSSAISTSIKKLERDKGLVHKTRLKEDERVVFVELSTKGQETLEIVKSNRAQRFAILLSAINASHNEVEVVQRILDRAIKFLDQQLKFGQ